MLAALNGKTRIVDALVKAGARVNERSADGKTALMFAAGAGRTYTVGALLAAGADASRDRRLRRDRTRARAARTSAATSRACCDALEVQPEESLGTLVRGRRGPGRRRSGSPTTSTLISALLAKGADVNARSSEGKTALAARRRARPRARP